MYLTPQKTYIKMLGCRKFGSFNELKLPDF